MANEDEKRTWEIDYDKLAERVVENTDFAAMIADISALSSRLTAARASHLDNIDNANLKTMAAMRGTDGASLASAWTAALATALGNYNATRAGYLDAISRGRPSMIFPSAIPKAIVAVPAVGNVADLAFPDVVVAGLPDGLTIARADIALIVGALLDTSTTENQIAAASKTLRVKLSTGAWGTNDIVALTFVLNSLQVDASAYRGGVVLFGGTDVKSVVAANGTYNFRSDQSERTDAVIATGDDLELLDVSVVIRVWFN